MGGDAIATLLKNLAHPYPVKNGGIATNDHGEGEDVLLIEDLGLEIWLYDLCIEEERVGIVTRTGIVKTTRYTIFPVAHDLGDRDIPESTDVGIPTVVYGLPKCLEEIAARVGEMEIQRIMEPLLPMR